MAEQSDAVSIANTHANYNQMLKEADREGNDDRVRNLLRGYEAWCTTNGVEQQLDEAY